MTHPTRAFSGSIINRFTGSKILARVGQISVAFPHGNDTQKMETVSRQSPPKQKRINPIQPKMQYLYGSGNSNVLTTALPSMLMKNHRSALYFMP